MAKPSLALAEQIKSGKIKGTLRFYGYPAEEGEAPRRSWCEPTFLTTAMLRDWHPGARILPGEGTSQDGLQ